MMRRTTLLILSPLFLTADNLSSALSSQGFTGLINTPNAQVIKEGDVTFQFNNQFDNHLRAYNSDKEYSFEENYIAGVGLFPNFEFEGRLVEARGYARDLSANFKYKIPYEHKYLPNIALGLQDFGGVANHYINNYIVADKEFGFLRTSLGYGKAGENKRGQRMDGLFGGVEAKVTDWVSVMAEHDGKENHAAIRMALPDSLLSSVKLEAMLAQNLTEKQTHFSVNLTLPLGGKDTTKEPYESKGLAGSQKVSTQALYSEKNEESTYAKIENTPLVSIQNRLVQFGFENVQVGAYENSIYVKFENSMFDHTDLDALGYVIGNISNMYKENKHYIVTLLKNNLQTITVSGESRKFQAYVKNPTPLNNRKLQENLAFSRTFDETNVHFISSKQNSSFFKPRVELSPHLLTTVGTEIGIFDYATTLRTNLYMPLYDGVVLSAMYENPLFHSKNFDDDKPYGIRNANRLKSRFRTIMAHQTSHYESLFNTLSIGQYGGDYYGVMNQSHLSTIDGEHGVSLKLGLFKNKDSNLDEDKNIYLASYRYFYEPLNLFSKITYGQYWHQDRGVTLEFKRFFDQTSVGLYFQDVGYKFAGIRVTLPLSTRKLYNSKILKVKGKSDFSYALATTLKEPTGGNVQRPNGGIIPLSDFEVASSYLDRDRLNANYIRGNVERMRDAYINY